MHSAAGPCFVRSMRIVPIAAALTIVALPAFAAGLDDPSLQGASRYDRCLSLARSDANRAYSEAAKWEVSGGGAAATHCAAMALVQLRRYTEAATKLDTLARGAAGNSAAQRSMLFGQAGNAWLLAGNSANAEAALNAALALTPNDADLLTDRARARGMRKDWKGAEADLSSILSRDPNRADLYVLRASARHALGRKNEARADLESALKVVTNYPDALVERGEMKAEAGDTEGAKADWNKVIASAPGSAAARSAKADLDQLAAPAPSPGK